MGILSEMQVMCIILTKFTELPEYEMHSSGQEM